MLSFVILVYCVCVIVFFFKQKTAYEMRISDWSSDVCSSDLATLGGLRQLAIMLDVETGIRLRVGMSPCRCVMAGRLNERAQPNFAWIDRHLESLSIWVSVMISVDLAGSTRTPARFD